MLGSRSKCLDENAFLSFVIKWNLFFCYMGKCVAQVEREGFWRRIELYNLIICCSVSIILRISGSFEANLVHHLFLPIKVTYFCSVLPGEGSKTRCSNDAFFDMNVLFPH